jgi:hypothetical protein
MRVLIQGDSHGNVNDIIPKIYTAGKHRIQHVLVVGDFGLWTHKADGQEFLDEVNEAARINNLSVYAIGGNHENWDHWNWICENMPTSKGFAMARRRVLLAPKTHHWTWAGKTFIGAGGAVSVDKDYRLAAERGDIPGVSRSGPNTLYWPNETLTDEDVWDLKSMGTADYLISHDCSDHTPWKTRLKPDADSVLHREKMDKIIASVQPKMHFHGHMHTQYDWVNKRSHGLRESAFGDDESEWNGVETRTLGLEAFKDFNSWGVLDVEDEAWYWPREFYAALDERAARKEAHDEARYAKSVENQDP